MMADRAALTGLAPAEAAARLAAEGPNALARAGRRSVLRIALEVLREPRERDEALALLKQLGALLV